MPELITPFPLMLVTAVLAYLLGAVPFGIVMARLFGLGDLRSVGSGNIGATNVLRTGNKLAAFLTLLLDSGKGAIAVLLAWGLVGPDAAQLAGLAAFIGHCFPIYLGFKGGKGVATYLGTILALSFITGFAACMTWLVIALLFRFSSLAALITAVMVPAWAWSLGRPDLIALTACLGLLVWVRHRANIERLLSGQETRINLKKG